MRAGYDSDNFVIMTLHRFANLLTRTDIRDVIAARGVSIQ